MKNYYIYLIFIEKNAASIQKEDLVNLEKVTKHVVERLNRKMESKMESRYYLNGVAAVIQENTNVLKTHLCMNMLEYELENVLTDEYQTSFIYTDYLVSEDQLDFMLYKGCLQYEHSLNVPNSRHILKTDTIRTNTISTDTAELQMQLHNLLLKGDYEQSRLIFTQLHSEYQNEAFQKQSRMKYRLSLMNILFTMSHYTEEEEEDLGQILFTMPLSKTWHRFMLSAMYRICSDKSGNKDAVHSAGFLRKVHLWIDKEISNPDLNLKMAADAFGLTPSYFSTIFKKNMQINFLSYVENKRMNIGYSMLNQGNVTVEKVAKACGYENVSTFRRNFKKFFNQNPVEVLYGERE